MGIVLRRLRAAPLQGRRAGARFAALALACALLAMTLLLGTRPAAAGASAAPPAPDAALVGIPYLGTTTIDIGPPWRIADCAVPLAATALVVGCDEQSVTLAAPTYDPEAGTVSLGIPLTDGRITTTAAYRIALEPPSTPTAAPGTELRPVRAGTLLRLPLSELGVECEVCSGTGGRLSAITVHPADAGSLWATPTHLVFRAAADARGPAELVYRFADDFGAWSADASVPVSILAPADRPLATSDLVVELDAGAASVDLNRLAFPLDGGEVVIVGCGDPIRGQVTCAADGSAEYRGDGGIDQFAFQVATAEGGRAFGSVTLVPAGTEAPAVGTAPIAAPEQGKTGVAVLVPPAPPSDDHASDSTGLLTPLLDVLDRVGAR